MDKKTAIRALKTVVLSTIRNIPDNYRCYDITRLLKAELAKHDISFEVRDGLASYYPLSFFTAAKRGECRLLIPERSVRETVGAAKLAYEIAERQDLENNINWRISIKHSWGIVEGKFLVDYHRMIDLRIAPVRLVLKRFPVLKSLVVLKLLKIEPLKNLPNSWAYCPRDVIYMESARQIGNMIHYPSIDYSEELRYVG